MSEKQAKAKRREQAQEKKPIGQITINVYDNLDVDVANFPSESNMALMVLANATSKVAAYFMEEAQKNKSNILLARPGASQADIIKMAGN